MVMCFLEMQVVLKLDWLARLRLLVRIWLFMTEVNGIVKER